MHYLDDNRPELGHISYILTESRIQKASSLLEPNDVVQIELLNIGGRTGREPVYYYRYDERHIKSVIPYIDINEEALDGNVLMLDMLAKERTYIEFYGCKVERKYCASLPYKYYSVPYIMIPRDFANIITCGRSFYDSTTNGFLTNTKHFSVHYAEANVRSDTVRKTSRIISDYEQLPPFIEFLCKAENWEPSAKVLSIKPRLFGRAEIREKTLEYMLRFSEYFFDEQAMSPASSSIAMLYERQSKPYKRYRFYKTYKQLTAEEVVSGKAFPNIISERILPHYA